MGSQSEKAVWTRQAHMQTRAKPRAEVVTRRPSHRYIDPAKAGCQAGPKGTDMWSAALELTDIHSRKPGGKRGPTATENGYQERSNPTLAVRPIRARTRQPRRNIWVQPRRACGRDGLRSKCPGSYPNGPSARRRNGRDRQTETTTDGMRHSPVGVHTS